MKGTHSLLILLVLTILLAGAALFIGPVSNPSWAIIQGIRFPRVLLAIIVGAGLAGSGAVLQGVLRNPLADPSAQSVPGYSTSDAKKPQSLQYINQFRESIRIFDREVSFQNSASCCNGISVAQGHTLLEIEKNKKDGYFVANFPMKTFDREFWEKQRCNHV